VLQCVAVRYSRRTEQRANCGEMLLQTEHTRITLLDSGVRGTEDGFLQHLLWCGVMQRVAVRDSVLQCVAVRCSVLGCVAVCCSAWQSVAVCCKFLQHLMSRR